MVYADFAYYRDTYMGKAVAEADFPRLAFRASAFLDYFTLGRAARNPELEQLKMACCALTEQVQTVEEAEDAARKSLTAASKAAAAGGEVQSETVGSHSRSFRSGTDSAAAASQAAAEARKMMAELARQYLAGTGLIYRGGRPRE